jgi:acyl dehydratase
MPLNAQRLLERVFPDREFTYDVRDTALYALCTGMAQDPVDVNDLGFVNGPAPKVLPTQSTAIAFDYRFIEGSGIDEFLILHAGQSVTVHAPLPPSATVVCSFRILDIFDKGAGRGAVIVAEARLREQTSGTLLCTNVWTSYARGEGGFGGERGPRTPVIAIPERAPDQQIETKTMVAHPLFYQLLGDTNAVHIDPEAARKGGFDRPIMHGLCTYGIACRAVVVGICGHDPDRIQHFDGQFTAPVFPGETIVTSLWRDGDRVTLRSAVRERGVTVLVATATFAQDLASTHHVGAR